MADSSTEKVNQLITDFTDTTPKISLTTLFAQSDAKHKDALIAVNGTALQKRGGPRTLPKLIESTQTGYTGFAKKGVVITPITSHKVICCTVGRHLIERSAAYDYVMMANAALQDSILLKIVVAFRDMKTQEGLYRRRVNPDGSLTPEGVQQGVAAYPGTSNHQMGIALDIDVKMPTPAQYVQARDHGGKFSPEFIWLAGNMPPYGNGTDPGHAAAFGFDHKEGNSVNEPWHWTHLNTGVIKGISTFQTVTGFELLTTETALAASSVNQTGDQLVVNLEAHDKTVGRARATTMQSSPRSTFYKYWAQANADQGNDLKNLLSQLQAATVTIQEEPKGFVPGSYSSLSYNFDTGKWGDGEEV